eukprot:Gb_23682 [translate_table: standard]
MDDHGKRKADDELTEIAEEFKRGRMSNEHQNRLYTDEKSPVKSSSVEVFAVGSDERCPENESVRPECGSNQVFCDVRLDVSDKSTLIWLESKQNARFFNEEYGVNLLRQGTPSSDIESKADSQLDPLCFRVSMETSETCDLEEAQWFVKQAANLLREITSQGVYVKCFWYQGPLPPGTDGTPSVSSVVKKIKGHDGKNLERIQDRTGVIIGVVLNNKAIATAQSSVNPLPHRIIGVRMRCIRRRGVCEASKKIQQLLGLAGDYFLKEMRTEVKEKDVVYADSMHCRPMASLSATIERNCATGSGTQYPRNISLPSHLSSEKPESEFTDGYLHRKVLDSLASMAHRKGADAASLSSYRESHLKDFHEQPDTTKDFESRNRPNQLYVYDLPSFMPARMVKSIFQRVVCEKLDLPYTCEIVLHAVCVTDQPCAIVQFATESLLIAALQLYADDKTVFDGLKIGLHHRASILKPERPNYYNGMSMKIDEQTSFSQDDERYIQKEFPTYSNQCKPEQRYIEHNQRRANATPWWDYVVDKPKPLFLTELTPNASAQSIRQLFEDVLTHYVGLPLVSSAGRQLVLDVRYVPSKGCAFVDMATPELVEFMLELHAQQPELFFYMKMEVGNRDIHDIREEIGRPDFLEHDIRPNRHPAKFRGKMHRHNNFESPGAYGFLGRGAKRTRYFAFAEDSDDYYYEKPFDLRKRVRSDPNKTVFAHGFPPNASRQMICRIFERVLRQDLKEAIHDEIIAEIRMPSKSYAFIVFATEEFTRLALQLYAQDRDIFDKVRLEPHFDSELEGPFWDCFYEQDRETHSGFVKGIEFSNQNRQRHDDFVDNLSKNKPGKEVNPSSEPQNHLGLRAIQAPSSIRVDND